MNYQILRKMTWPDLNNYLLFLFLDSLMIGVNGLQIPNPLQIVFFPPRSNFLKYFSYFLNLSQTSAQWVAVTSRGSKRAGRAGGRRRLSHQILGGRCPALCQLSKIYQSLVFGTTGCRVSSLVFLTLQVQLELGTLKESLRAICKVPVLSEY